MLNLTSPLYNLYINLDHSFGWHCVRVSNCNTSQILVFGGYLKVRESLYTQVIIWVKTILNHIYTWAIKLGMRVLAWYIGPNGLKSKYTIKCPYSIVLKILKSSS